MTTTSKPVPPVAGPALSVHIPEALVKAFGKDLRLVLGHHLINGIPVPEFIIRELKPTFEVPAGWELFMVPKQGKMR